MLPSSSVGAPTAASTTSERTSSTVATTNVSMEFAVAPMDSVAAIKYPPDDRMEEVEDELRRKRTCDAEDNVLEANDQDDDQEKFDHSPFLNDYHLASSFWRTNVLHKAAKRPRLSKHDTSSFSSTLTEVSNDEEEDTNDAPQFYYKSSSNNSMQESPQDELQQQDEQQQEAMDEGTHNIESLTARLQETWSITNLRALRRNNIYESSLLLPDPPPPQPLMTPPPTCIVTARKALLRQRQKAAKRDVMKALTRNKKSPPPTNTTTSTTMAVDD